MLQHKKLILLCCLALLLLAFTSLGRLNGYGLSWWTLEDGGANGDCYQVTTGFALCGAIGQADAGGGTGGGYQVQSGFWVGPPPIRYQVLLPLVVK